MDLPELEVLIGLAQAGSFSRAAENLHRSQPAVSQAIRRLEDELQTQLMDRSSRKVVLTAAGATLLAYAKRMVQLRDEARRALQDLRTFKRGVLRLAANESVCAYVLPPLLKAFRQACPGVKIEVIQCPSNDIARALEEQDIDFGFLSFTPVQHDLVSRLLFRDEQALAVFPGHPLARAKSVVMGQLVRERFIAHLVDTPGRRRLIDHFVREGVPLNIVMELSNLETIKDFVRAGEGLAILPRMCMTRELAAGELFSPKVRGMAIGRDIRVVYPRDRTQSPGAAAFFAMLEKQFPIQEGAGAADHGEDRETETDGPSGPTGERHVDAHAPLG
jgi:DNA-binding transcriptional LysR family regulator